MDGPLFLSRLSKIKLLAIISKLEQSGLPKKIAQKFFNEYFCFTFKRIGSLFPKLFWPKGQEISKANFLETPLPKKQTKF